MNTPIVDAQVHVWKASSPDRPWPDDAIAPQREIPLEIPELSQHMQKAGVTAALLLGPTWEGARNDYVLAAAASEPGRYGALCRFPTGDPAAVEQLAGWRSRTGALGIRMSLNRGDVRGTLAAAISSGFFAAAAAHHIPLSIYAPGRYWLYEHLVQHYPDLKITVDHAGVETRTESLLTAIEPLLALAKYPGIAVKASALPCFVSEGYPFPSIVDAVYWLVAAFGAERVFWGSDLSRLPIPYSQLVDVFLYHTDELSQAERRLVLGGALLEWLDWRGVTSAE
ncbi:amidohydrolase (plasmid) [Mycolicibacterium madagascariense]|uniref:Amidohydrolase n=1 Tax=Mycolicibacterium madagascariense TaxID=212765 RepID=A0A7I7XPQ6_9MYCO|nr:amidohydrolase family protein [Mycolicibacterium madagascariense]BBZ31219.1 amidohydrolase [Mycolicibacterium madagascariense]